jgi:hypothetical protein
LLNRGTHARCGTGSMCKAIRLTLQSCHRGRTPRTIAEYAGRRARWRRRTKPVPQATRRPAHAAVERRLHSRGRRRFPQAPQDDLSPGPGGNRDTQPRNHQHERAPVLRRWDAHPGGVAKRPGMRGEQERADFRPPAAAASRACGETQVHAYQGRETCIHCARGSAPVAHVAAVSRLLSGSPAMRDRRSSSCSDGAKRRDPEERKGSRGVELPFGRCRAGHQNQGGTTSESVGIPERSTGGGVGVQPFSDDPSQVSDARRRAPGPPRRGMPWGALGAAVERGQLERLAPLAVRRRTARPPKWRTCARRWGQRDAAGSVASLLI